MSSSCVTCASSKAAAEGAPEGGAEGLLLPCPSRVEVTETRQRPSRTSTHSPVCTGDGEV